MSSDRAFLSRLVRFLAGLVAIFVALAVVLSYALQGTVEWGYLGAFFLVVFGLPIGVLALFARGRNGGSGDDA